ncbi:hypothetical protein [Herbiconiux daphne]|uniref:Uncharacterized protein n=1 Tax=Herbiconiux daphne TaxID=2970914 RepID=A0ABT2H9V1_9MICO|nr:hypothetical protein [Herbiconiux daphne]MCS5736667.1 hypothetical protein [Herbiconiux daphne]
MDILLKRSIDVINPVFVLTDPDKIGFIGINYLYMPDLKRFYFVDSIENVADNLWMLKCTCDVLETYKADIRYSFASWKRPMKTGDCFNASFDTCAYTTITTHKSDVTPDVDSVMILSTVGVS